MDIFNSKLLVYQRVPPILVSGSYIFYIFLPSYTQKNDVNFGWMVISVMDCYGIFAQQKMGIFCPTKIWAMLASKSHPSRTEMKRREVPEERFCCDDGQRRWMEPFFSVGKCEDFPIETHHFGHFKLHF